MSTLRKIAIVGAMSAALAGTSVTSALADPSPLPPWRSLTDIVGVSAGQTRLFDKLSSKCNDGNPRSKLWSWDSVNAGKYWPLPRFNYRNSVPAGLGPGGGHRRPASGPLRTGY